MGLRRVVDCHESAPGNTHLGCQVWSFNKKRNCFPKLLHIARWKEEAGLALLKASKCPDFVLDRGHWFAEGLTEPEKLTESAEASDEEPRTNVVMRALMFICVLLMSAQRALR